MNSPVDLAYELPWVGTFAVRFKRFESYFLLFLGKLQRGDEKPRRNYGQIQNYSSLMQTYIRRFNSFE
jgi:hypothetical protein